jgi:hypothetical protein
MRSSDLGFVVVMLLAGGVTALGLAVFPPGRAAGVYPTITAWAPASAVGLGMLTLFGAAACSGVVSLMRALPAGTQVFESDGGPAMLPLAVLPLAGCFLLLAGAADQVGRYGLRGVVWAVVCTGFAVALGVAGGALAWTREEVRVLPGQIAVVTGRGIPTVRYWRGAEIRLECSEVRVYKGVSWKVELVSATGERQVVGRARTEADAIAARDAILASVRTVGS